MKYYVYTLAHNDTIFYVGKGSGKRIADHEKEALRGHNCPKCELIRSIWRDGGTIQRAIVFETDDERAALDHEAALIRAYGYERLMNRTPGGKLSRRPRRERVGRDLAAAELVDQLFKTHRHPEGREYTFQEVVAKLKTLGISIDYTTLSKVRSGDIANPGRRVLLGLCQFFRVPASYFFPELDELGPQQETPEEQLHAAFRSMGVPLDVQEHLIGVARTFKKPSNQ